MKTSHSTAVVALAASLVLANAQVCVPEDGYTIKEWMRACDSVVGGSSAKCSDRTCHTALHRLEEEETHECWEHLGLGTHKDFEKYAALDAFCHGEGPDPELREPTPAPTNTTLPICTPQDGEAIKGWMKACDSVVGGSTTKCSDRACHVALHRLEEEETHECWEHLGLGTHEDFEKYAALDAFCHGEGPDPEFPGATPAPTNTTLPICTPQDGEAIKGWMKACDSVVGGSTAKCSDRACHTALHRLEEEETHECWEHLGLGTHKDFEKYAELDAFCHGEGPDPEH
ncbi:hypothetical protein Poli38472_006675 [Pythium oligandrum]|uniref:Uncharacterized protein n=1 Tax=Pythium oligandrum TaxID=41045 RepID=A0A8K1C579_PYTOL|nr:hypothetical protein Poli38472_006675 [Pythium oligandrum]|eukprot:TMW56665.1 hypothetical protein Poli38472_006675 [Pythium oligandrum]